VILIILATLFKDSIWSEIVAVFINTFFRKIKDKGKAIPIRGPGQALRAPGG
jgi:hypothetical protein